MVSSVNILLLVFIFITFFWTVQLLALTILIILAMLNQIQNINKLSEQSFTRKLKLPIFFFFFRTIGVGKFKNKLIFIYFLIFKIIIINTYSLFGNCHFSIGKWLTVINITIINTSIFCINP
jgi:hypothetical protein